MKLFSILGNPVSHSISPKMHNTALNGLHINGCYIRTCIEDGSTLLNKFHSLKLDGANVTVPHKEFAYELCDELDSFAKQIGAVNTLVKKNNKVYGYNTDAPGFYKAIESFGSIKTALILGAGGTAKAIATILKEKNINVTVLNRSQNRLHYFYENGFNAYSWDNFKPSSYELIINTTSAGLSDESLPLDQDLLNTLMQKSQFAFDVIYNKKTPFLQKAASNNLQYKDGADMLLYQGVLAFNLFFDNKLDNDKITKYMKKTFKTK
ncbi:shikimate dehydrogenase [Sulfurospirillum arcachonense]|uniref:shikimate dehydrogenase n=1 Tax=Sulfurospirillum arcachonense TaxID=57666 RepID=UPI0004697A42|nr:shikimate dehydrogenase [Sulfurospirillum arcachonense]